MIKFKFCSKCGAPSEDAWTGYYDQETGEKVMKSVCSFDQCHTEHDCRPQPIFARGDEKCIRCGAIFWCGF